MRKTISKSTRLIEPSFYNLSTRNLRTYFYSTLAGLAVLTVATLAISFASSNNMPTFAEEVSTDIATAGSYYLNITANNAVSLSVDSPSVDSAIASVSDTVTVKTNSGSGYQLYLSMATGSTSNALTYNTTVNGNSQTYTLPATTAVDTLSNDSWGYSTDNSTWKAVPLNANNLTVSDAIKTTNAANEVGDTTTIYYGAKVTSATVPGTYTGTVMYSALGDAAAQAEVTTATTAPSSFIYNNLANKTLIITTPLFTNMNIDTSKVSVAFNDVNTTSCPVTALTSPDGQLVVSCTLPSLPVGTYTATISVADFGKTYTGSVEYKASVSSATFNTTSVSPNTATDIIIDTDADYSDTSTPNASVTYSGGGAASCTTPTITNNGGKVRLTCNSTFTTAGSYTATITINGTSATTSNAITVSNPAKTFFTATTMQQVDISPQFCSSATTPAENATAIDTTGAYAGNTSYIPQTTLVDTREGSINSYIIRKLADGNCWMVQNLNLGDSLTTSSAVLQLTTEDSDISATFSLPASSGTSSDPNTASWTDTNPPTAAKMNNPGNIWFTDGTTQTTTQPTDSTQSATRSIGNYYNFYAATQNHMTQTSPSYSICPKGWQLPANSGDKSWYNLITTVYKYTSNDSTASSTANDTTLLNGPLQLMRSGAFYTTSAHYQGTNGNFWSGVQNSNTYGYSLGFDSSRLNPQNSDYKRVGYSIRCVSRQ